MTQSVSADPVLERVAIGGGAGRGPAVEIPQTIDSLAVGGGLLHTWADDERSIRTTDLASGLQAATATSSRSDNPYQDSLAATTDGTLYRFAQSVYRLAPGGTEEIVPAPNLYRGTVTTDGVIVGLNPSSSGPALLRVNADGTSTPLSIPAAAYEVRFIDSDHAGGVLVSTSTQVFRVTPAGVVTKVAGGDNHPIPVGTPAADYRFAEIDYAVSAPDGGFYIVTWGAGWNGSVIWSIDASGIITSYRDAPFNRRIVAAGADDSGLYLAAPSAPYDNINGARQVFRVVPATGHATLVAGSLRSAYVPDGGSALDAVIPNGDGESVDAAGNIYLPISADGIVARIDASGVITRFAGGGAGTSDGGLATDATLTEPCATTSDRSGNVFIADRSITAYSRIYRADLSGRISRYAGRTSANPPATDPPRLRTSLRSPCRLVIDGNGRLIILDGTRRTDFNNMYKGVSARRVEADAR